MKVLFPASILFLVMSAHAADAVKSGLIAEYYEFDTGVGDFPNIPAEKKPSIRRVERQISVDSCDSNFNNTNLDKNFYTKWTGAVKIDKPGKYKFFLESDDGSRMYLDGKLVVNSPGTHAMDKKEGAVELVAGLHEIKIEYFQGDGGMGCKFTWVQPGKNEEVVGENNLVHQAEVE